MRELKFRAWDKKKKVMVYDFVLSSNGNVDRIWSVEEYYPKALDYFDRPGDYYVLDGTDFYANDEYVVMQYTGLKDKTGKEIYEGDIVGRDFIHANRDKIGVYDEDNKALVEYRGGIYYPFSDSCGYCREAGWQPRATKVLGNIYENPEL